MQEIFYNGNIVTNNENKEIHPAMLVNDGSVVFVSSNGDVLNLKTEDTKLVNLNEKFVYPSYFGLNSGVFDKIDKKIKNAKHVKNFQNPNEINENYDNFANFEEYKNEYLKLEKRLLKQGVTTLSEFDIGEKEFAFWKKMSEEKLLSLDIVAYVDLFNSKQVMDDNCVTYRKYKNHFRLGGYYLKMDGRIDELGAWLSRSYSGTKNYHGMGSIYGEQLYFLLKTVLEEKKQVVFELHGDKSMEEILTVFEELEEKDKVNNFYRPVFFCSGFISSKLYGKLKHFDVSVLLQAVNEKQYKVARKFLGFRRKKCFWNLDSLVSSGVRTCVSFLDAKSEIFAVSLFNLLGWKKRKTFLKLPKFIKNSSVFTEIMLKLLYTNPAYICFDLETKGSLDNQKHASFLVCNNDLFTADDIMLNKVYLSEQ